MASEDDARRIVGALTLAEQVRLLSGRDAWHVAGVESAGLVRSR